MVLWMGVFLDEAHDDEGCLVRIGVVEATENAAQ